MIRRWSLGVCVIGLLASAVLAKEGVVTTLDGRMIQGDIQESADGKTLDITVHSGTVTLSRTEIASVSYSTDAAADFHQRLKALDSGDITGRLELSRMELNAKQYDLAAEAANDVDRIDPHNPDAAILLDTIQSQRMLDAKSTGGGDDASAGGPTSQPAVNPAPSTYLTMDDVYTIRRFELTRLDTVRVSFYNDVRRRYLQGRDVADQFNAETPAQQADDIFQTGDANLIKDVRIESDPRDLAEFRRKVQPLVLASCVSCHSGNGAGGLVLFPDAKEATVAYTNFYILQKSGWKVHGTDLFGSGPVYRSMIDRVRPENSLLLQYGMPPSVAQTPHPAVKDFRPMFRDTSDPAYVEVLGWITSLPAMAPDYGIKYEIPTGSESTPAPATQAQ